MPHKQKNNADFVIIGAGILGLSIAKELKQRHPNCTIILFEKENEIGLHASGRNSGVMHSGIYYPEESLKAKLCAAGAKAWSEYCDEYQLPIARMGKVIVPLKLSDDVLITQLFHRGQYNGAKVEIIDQQQLKQLEPSSYSVTGRALYSHNTSVISPPQILNHLRSNMKNTGVEFRFNSLIKDVDLDAKQIIVNNDKIYFGHLFNTAGLYADKVAQQCGLDRRYLMIPFKGLYYKLRPDSQININRLIYPVPDLNVPFLGVHFTKAIDGTVYVGPTAIPAFGREHYNGLKGVKFFETLRMTYQLAQQYFLNKQGFRNYAHNETSRFFKSRFIQAAKALVPDITKDDLIKCSKVGIRAQLLDLKKRELVMDFLVENQSGATHILNAVSPAFTSAFSFSKFILDTIEANNKSKLTEAFIAV